MEAARVGDAVALATLFDRYHARLFAFLVRRTDRDAAEDLLQETWLRVVRGRGRYESGRRFSTWLFAIAINLCLDRGRRKAVERREREIALRASHAEGAQCSASGPDQGLDLQRVLAALPEPQREVFLLRRCVEFSEQEVAEILGLPVGTVKSRLHTAVHALRRSQESSDVG